MTGSQFKGWRIHSLFSIEWMELESVPSMHQQQPVGRSSAVTTISSLFGCLNPCSAIFTPSSAIANEPHLVLRDFFLVLYSYTRRGHICSKMSTKAVLSLSLHYRESRFQVHWLPPSPPRRPHYNCYVYTKLLRKSINFLSFVVAKNQQQSIYTMKKYIKQ